MLNTQHLALSTFHLFKTAAKIGDKVEAAVGGGDAKTGFAVKTRQNIVAMRPTGELLCKPHVPYNWHITRPSPVFANGIIYIAHTP